MAAKTARPFVPPAAGEIIEGVSKIDKEEKKASDVKQSKIVWIPTNKIVPCRWGTGIRDEEKYKRLVESIKQRGLDDNPHVRLNENDLFEPFIGDHRRLACTELKWPKIPCIIENISEKEARERCLNNNLSHSDYDSVGLENQVSEMWKSQQYESKQQLGNTIGLSGQRIGQLIGAKEIREKAKIPFDASISTQTINDTYPLSDINDKLALLELVRAKKIKPSDVREYATTLAKTSEDTRRKVLYEGQPLSSIGIEKLKLPKKTISTAKQVHNPNLLPEIYELLRIVQDHVALIKDEAEKKKAIAYVKYYTGLFLKILYAEGKIGKEFFESVVRHELDIDKDMLHHFDGLRTKGVGYWLSSDHDAEDSEDYGLTSSDDNKESNSNAEEDTP